MFLEVEKNGGKRKPAIIIFKIINEYDVEQIQENNEIITVSNPNTMNVE